MVRFFASEEVIQKFSWDFCTHFHSTVAAALQQDCQAIEDVGAFINQAFYQNLQRFNSAEHLRRQCRLHRFHLNASIHPPTASNPEPQVKIIAELIPLDVYQRVFPYGYEDDHFVRRPH